MLGMSLSLRSLIVCTSITRSGGYCDKHLLICVVIQQRNAYHRHIITYFLNTLGVESIGIGPCRDILQYLKQ